MVVQYMLFCVYGFSHACHSGFVIEPDISSSTVFLRQQEWQSFSFQTALEQPTLECCQLCCPVSNADILPSLAVARSDFWPRCVCVWHDGGTLVHKPCNRKYQKWMIPLLRWIKASIWLLVKCQDICQKHTVVCSMYTNSKCLIAKQ